MENIIRQDYSIKRSDRKQHKGHGSCVVWFTGLSGSGKSTIANEVEQQLFRQGLHCYSLDGDNIRSGLNRDLGFSPEDRKENIRRIAEVAKLMADAGIITLAAFISPKQSDRETVKEIIGATDFVEIFVDTPLQVCEERDVKGLYKKARKGEIPEFTGISAPYEAPLKPDLVVKTETEPLQEAAARIVSFLSKKLKA